MDYTIYTLGDYNFAHQVLNGIGAMFSSNGAIWGMISVMGVLSLFYNFFMMPHKDKPGDPIKQFIFGMLAVYILMGPDSKVSVRVESVNTNQFHVVDNIPFIVGFGGFITTGMMREIYEEYIWVYTSPSGDSVDNSVLRPLEAMSAIRNINQDPYLCKLGSSSKTFNLCSSLNAYMKNCYLRSLSASNSEKDPDASHEKSAKDSWPDKFVHNVFWTTPSMLDRSVAGEEIACPDAYSALTPFIVNGAVGPDGGYSLTSAMDKAINKRGSSIEDAASLLNRTFKDNLLSGNAAATAYDIILGKFLYIAEVKAAATGVQPSLSDVATFQAIEQRRVQMGSDRSLWMEMSVPLVTFFESFAIFLAPIIALLMIVGGNAITASITYLGLFLWTAMWPIIMVLINLYTDYAMDGKFYASYGNGINPLGVGTLDNTLVELESFLAQASVLITLVPTLSLFVIYRGVHTMLSASSKAAPSTSVDSKLVAPDIASAANAGRYQQGAHSGSLDQMSGSWNSSYDTGNHSAFGSMNTGETISGARSQMESASETKVKQATSGYTSAINDMYSKSGGVSYQEFATNGRTETEGTTAQAMNSLAQNISTTNGISIDQAQEAVAAAAIKVGTPNMFGSSASGSAQVSEKFKDAVSKGLTASGVDASVASDSVSSASSKMKGFQLTAGNESKEALSNSLSSIETAGVNLSNATAEQSLTSQALSAMGNIGTAFEMPTQPTYTAMSNQEKQDKGSVLNSDYDSNTGQYTSGILKGQNVNDVYKQISGGDGKDLSMQDKAKQNQSFVNNSYSDGVIENEGHKAKGIPEALGMQNVVNKLNDKFAGADANEDRASISQGFAMSGSLFSAVGEISQNQNGTSNNADKVANQYKQLAEAAKGNPEAMRNVQGIDAVQAPVADPAKVEGAAPPPGQDSSAQQYKERGTSKGEAMLAGGIDALEQFKSVAKQSVDSHAISPEQLAEKAGVTPEQYEKLTKEISAPDSFKSAQESLQWFNDNVLTDTAAQTAAQLRQEGATQGESTGLALLAEASPEQFNKMMDSFISGDNRTEATSAGVMSALSARSSDFESSFLSKIGEGSTEGKNFKANMSKLDSLFEGDKENAPVIGGSNSTMNDMNTVAQMRNAGIDNQTSASLLSKASDPNSAPLTDREQTLAPAVAEAFNANKGNGDSDMSKRLNEFAAQSGGENALSESRINLQADIADTAFLGAGNTESTPIVQAAIDGTLGENQEAIDFKQRFNDSNVVSNQNGASDAVTLQKLENVASRLTSGGFESGTQLQNYVDSVKESAISGGNPDSKTISPSVDPEMLGNDRIEFDRDDVNGLMSAQKGDQFSVPLGNGAEKDFTIMGHTTSGNAGGGLSGVVLSDSDGNLSTLYQDSGFMSKGSGSQYVDIQESDYNNKSSERPEIGTTDAGDGNRQHSNDQIKEISDLGVGGQYSTEGANFTVNSVDGNSVTVSNDEKPDTPIELEPFVAAGGFTTSDEMTKAAVTESGSNINIPVNDMSELQSIAQMPKGENPTGKPMVADVMDVNEISQIGEGNFTAADGQEYTKSVDNGKVSVINSSGGEEMSYQESDSTESITFGNVPQNSGSTGDLLAGDDRAFVFEPTQEAPKRNVRSQPASTQRELSGPGGNLNSNNNSSESGRKPGPGDRR